MTTFALIPATKPFYIGIYPVTQEEYERVMGNNPSYFKGKNHPVDNISWLDAQEYCKKLTEIEKGKLKAGEIYRLPTEEEWEFACRAYNGDINDYAWYDKNSNGETHQVGQKKPNEFGLYDMLGNVKELCKDRYNDDLVGVRGGSYLNSAPNCSTKIRDNAGIRTRSKGQGFRIVRDATPVAMREKNEDKGRFDLLPPIFWEQFEDKLLSSMATVANREVDREVDWTSPLEELVKLAPKYGIELASLFQRGAKKYAERNWEKGMPFSWRIDSLMRHLFKSQENGAIDEETGIPHIVCAIWNAMCLLHWIKNNLGTDDWSKK